jgi:DNA-binding transcriptional ArsR family regulator
MQAKKAATLTDLHLEEVSQLFSVLSESSRLKLLRALMERDMTVSELMDATEMKQGNVSKHLGVLLSNRFVERTQEGNFARYTLCDPTIVALCKLMCERIEADAQKRVKALSVGSRR